MELYIGIFIFIIAILLAISKCFTPKTNEANAAPSVAGLNESPQHVPTAPTSQSLEAGDGVLHNLSRMEVTALTGMMNRPQPSSSAEQTVPPSTFLPVVPSRSNNFRPFVRHSPANDRPPAYDEVGPSRNLSSANVIEIGNNPPDYSVYVIPTDKLPPPPDYATVGFR